MNSRSLHADDVQNGQLENAFLLFNELSEKLTESYRELECQVATLSGELAEARSERLKQLTEKETLAGRLESLLDALPGAVIVIDSHGVITQANPVAYDMLGDALCGRTWQDVSDEMFITGADELQLMDGRWLSLSTRRMEAGKGCIILLTDVSEMHELQQQLGRKQRLSSLGEMVASLAHQLRTPLSTALLSVSSLQHPNTRRSDIDRVSQRTRERLLHLERMVNDMLIFARGEHAELEMAGARDLMDRFRSDIQEQFVSTRFELDFINRIPHDIRLHINVDALLSALQNIVDNAIEALGRREKEEDSTWQGNVTIDACVGGAGDLLISFSDNGCGMSTQVVDRVLEPFYTTRSQGTGLGLAIVNATIEGIHGKLKIESSLGIGSQFQVILPAVNSGELLPGGFSGSQDSQIILSEYVTEEVKA